MSLPRRALGRLLKNQTAAVGLVVRAIQLLVGGLILATFLALFNSRRRVGARGRVAEVTPNVTGQIAAIPVSRTGGEGRRRVENDQNARKKRTSLDCPARFR